MQTEKEIYIDYIQTHYVPIFFKNWYLDAVCDEPWDVAIVSDGVDLSAAFVYMRKTKLGFNYIVQPENCPYTGPFFFKKKNQNAYQQLLVKLPEVDLHIQDYFFESTVKENTSIAHSRQTFIIEAGSEEVELYEALSKEFKYKIRKARKNITLESTDDFSEFIAFVELEFERKNQSIPYPKKSFIRLDKAVRKYGDRKIIKAYNKEDQVVAMAYFLEDEKWVYNFANAYNSESRHHAMNLIVWEEIMATMKKGKSFDFEGSSIPSIADFFRRFGGKKIVYPHHHYTKNKMVDFLFKLKTKMAK